MPEEPDDDVLLPWLDIDHAAAIGRLVSTWAHLEHEIDQLVWTLAGVEENPGACLTAQLSTVARRLDALISLLKLHSTDDLIIRKVAKFKGRTIELAEKRNRVVHDPWSYGYRSKKHYRLEVTARSKLEHRYLHVSTEDMDKITDEIKKASEWFGEIRSQILEKFYS
jgi:hypothetical protein